MVPVIISFVFRSCCRSHQLLPPWKCWINFLRNTQNATNVEICFPPSSYFPLSPFPHSNRAVISSDSKRSCTCAWGSCSSSPPSPRSWMVSSSLSLSLGHVWESSSFTFPCILSTSPWFSCSSRTTSRTNSELPRDFQRQCTERYLENPAKLRHCRRRQSRRQLKTTLPK